MIFLNISESFIILLKSLSGTRIDDISLCIRIHNYRSSYLFLEILSKIVKILSKIVKILSKIVKILSK